MPPLHGLRVIDLTRVLAGPYCAMMLGDMGADVIKVEEPSHGDDTRAWAPFADGVSTFFLGLNRSKRSVALDLKTPAGADALRGLLGDADVLIENFRPGSLRKLGFDYESIRGEFPQLIYCSVTGYGQKGPKRNLPGYDAVMQGEGGLMSITGAPDGTPYRLGVAIADIASGMFAAYGVAMGLLARERTGRGEYIDVGMLDSVAALLTYQAGICFAIGGAPPRLGNQHPTIVPYETLTASDGDLVVAAGNDTLFSRFCDVIGAPELARDPRFAANKGRVENQDALRPLLAERLRPTERLHPAERLRLAERLRQQAVSSRGRFHPVTQARDRLEDVFVGMGYTVAEGPEVETAWYNFEALNIPDWHPARGSFDTIFVDLGAPEEVMLRSHTSPVQIRVMEKRKPPVYIVAPGRTFRTDTADATHLPAFNQIEGLAVDRNITMGDLAGTIDEFVRAFFGREVKSRLRPSYFPFTEPSAEFDISRPDGSWLELGGCGMVHPNVLSNCGIDPEEWQGFAFGFGIDRLAVMRHEIDDIREFVNSDTRFLSQF